MWVRFFDDPGVDLPAVPDDLTGRELQQMIQELLPQKAGSKVALQHGPELLSMKKTLKELHLDLVEARIIERCQDDHCWSNWVTSLDSLGFFGPLQFRVFPRPSRRVAPPPPL